MTKKERFIEFMKEVKEDNKWDFIAVVIQTEGNPAPELIINPIENLELKMEYYDNAYNDDLVLKSFKGIRIIGWDAINDYEPSISTSDLISSAIEY